MGKLKNILKGTAWLLVGAGLTVGIHQTVVNWDKIEAFIGVEKTQPVDPPTDDPVVPDVPGDETDEPTAEVEYLPYTFSQGVLTSYTGEDTEIVIPAGYDVVLEGDQLRYVKGDKFAVTAIGASVFRNSDITSVELPDTVTEIQDRAFNSCESLVNLKLSKNLEKIGIYGITHTQLTELVMPDSLKEIGEYGLVQNVSLTKLTLNEGLEKINRYALQYNFGLEEITLPNSVTELGESCFRNCSALKQVTLGSQIKTIPDQCFQSTALTEFVVPSTVETLGSAIFASTSVKKVYIPESVKTLSEGAGSVKGSFAKGLSSDAVIWVEPIGRYEGWGEYFNCYGSTSSSSDRTNKLLKVNYGAPIEMYEQNRMELSGLAIIDGVLTRYYGNEEVVKIPASYTKIEANGFLYEGDDIAVTKIQEMAFSNNTTIKEVILSEGLLEIGNSVFAHSSLERINIPGTVKLATGAFEYAMALETVVLGAGITEIPQYCFRYTGLKNINIPTTVAKISSRAFDNTAIEKIFIPKEVVTIEGEILNYMGSVDIYTDATEKPQGWNDSFANGGQLIEGTAADYEMVEHTVHYGVSYEEYLAL